jgi:hypothetical protein
MTDITTVSFVVPTVHALEFQTRAQALLAELTGAASYALPPSDIRTPAASEFVPLNSKEVQGTDVWRLPEWRRDDHDRAAWVVNSLPAHPRETLLLLSRNAGTWVSGARIADELGLKHGAKSVPPSFKSMANRCRRADRRPTWDYDNQNGYRVSALVAELFLPKLTENES